MNRVVALLLVPLTTLAACGGKIDETSAEATSPAVYVREDTETIAKTSPGEVASVAVSCKAEDVRVDGGCDVTSSGTIVESHAQGTGWACSVTSSADDTRVHVWVRCAQGASATD